MSTHIRRSVCTLDCPDSCGVLVAVDTASGRALKLQGDPNHPVTRGFLCAKVNKYLDRVYAPDRVLHPLRRRGGFPKGSAGEEAFERISWDEALTAIAFRLQQAAKDHGPESILPYSYAGTTGALGYGSMDRRFFHRLGASRLDRTICATAGGEALLSVYGAKLGTDTEQFHRARLILAWGANIHSNNIHLWPQIDEARRNGAKLVVIDPYRTRTASLADLHLAPYPGTDAALALGLMHVILRDGLEDRAWTQTNTHGLPALREHVLPYTPARVEIWTGIPASTLEALAREYAATHPAVIRLNYGVQRSENGGAAVRAILMLPALTGAWQHLGGGAQLSTSGAFGFDKAALERPNLQPRSTRLVNMTLLGEALASQNIHALFVYNSNPAVIAPDQARVLQGLARPDLFTVVHEQAFTDTCRYADCILPATTFLETTDLQAAYGHYHVQLSEQAIAPVGEARSNVELFSALARRMGFTDPCFNDDSETLIAQALRESGTQPETLRGITRATLRAHGGSQRLRLPAQPFAQGPFPTPSGKVEFSSSTLKDPLPTYRPPAESRANAPAGMLEFLPRKGTHFMNSTFTDHPTHRALEKTCDVVELHPADAAARQIGDGTRVRIHNARGLLTLTARLSERVQPGVAAATLSRNEAGKGVNQLTSQRLTDLGAGPTFYSTLVYVDPCVEPAQHLFEEEQTSKQPFPPPFDAPRPAPIESQQYPGLHPSAASERRRDG